MEEEKQKNYLYTLPKELNGLLVEGFKRCYILYSIDGFVESGIKGISLSLTVAITLLLEHYHFQLILRGNSVEWPAIHNEYNKEKNIWVYAVDLLSDKEKRDSENYMDGR